MKKEDRELVERAKRLLPDPNKSEVLLFKVPVADPSKYSISDFFNRIPPTNCMKYVDFIKVEYLGKAGEKLFNWHFKQISDR